MLRDNNQQYNISSREITDTSELLDCKNHNQQYNIISREITGTTELLDCKIYKYHTIKQLNDFICGKYEPQITSIQIIMSNSDIRSIIYEDIDNDFSWGQYFEFKVIIMKRNGFINATKLCQNDGSGKKFKEWPRNKSSQELVAELEASPDSPGKSLIKIVTGPNLTRGTYAHSLLISTIAMWASSKFGLKVNRIVKDFSIRTYKDTIRMHVETINGKNTELVAKDDKIGELSSKIDSQSVKIDSQNAKIDSQSEEIRRLLNRSDQVLGTLNETKEKLDETAEEVVETKEEVRKITTKLNIAVEDRVPKAEQKAKLETFVLIKNDEEDKYDYYVMCGQKSYVNTKSKKYINEGVNRKELLRIEYQANSKNLLIRIKEQMEDELTYKGNNISIHNEKLTDKSFIKKIKEIDADKRKVSP